MSDARLHHGISLANPVTWIERLRGFGHDARTRWTTRWGERAHAETDRWNVTRAPARTCRYGGGRIVRSGSLLGRAARDSDLQRDAAVRRDGERDVAAETFRGRLDGRRRRAAPASRLAGRSTIRRTDGGPNPWTSPRCRTTPRSSSTIARRAALIWITGRSPRSTTGRSATIAPVRPTPITCSSTESDPTPSANVTWSDTPARRNSGASAFLT